MRYKSVQNKPEPDTQLWQLSGNAAKTDTNLKVYFNSHHLRSTFSLHAGNHDGHTKNWYILKVVKASWCSGWSVSAFSWKSLDSTHKIVSSHSCSSRSFFSPLNGIGQKRGRRGKKKLGKKINLYSISIVLFPIPISYPFKVSFSFLIVRECPVSAIHSIQLLASNCTPTSDFFTLLQVPIPIPSQVHG